MPFQSKSGLAILALAALAWTVCLGQAAAQASAHGLDQSLEQVSQETQKPERSETTTGGGQMSDQGAPGSISGTVMDQSGAVVAGAQVRLTSKNQLTSQEALSGIDGQFFFPSVAPGAFQLAITAAGFAPQSFSGILHAEEIETLPPIALTVADTRTEVQVSLTQVEVAEEQIKIEEKQRVLAVIPNFYVSYIPDAAPLTAKQKFKLAFRTMVDPFTIVIAGGVAGIEQAQNHFAEYGQGAQGYGKRFGASYADATTGTLIGAAILPALLKQDPRYFYKGTGSKVSRAWYAIGNAVICKGDNRRWQVNYSNILGSLAAGGISNLYYPRQDRNGAGLTFENATIGIGSTAIGNLFQEFVVRKLTPNASKQGPGTP
jgi:Carboxypeptidase regulatory-like domain